MTTLTAGIPVSPPAVKAVARTRRRVTPLSARGEGMLWLMGLGLAVCSVLIVSLIALIVVNGARTFWPRPIALVTKVSGERFLGSPIATEAFDPSDSDAAALNAALASGRPPSELLAEDGRPLRVLYRVGNREFNATPFRWEPLFGIASSERPPLAVMLERREWGVWFGLPSAVLIQSRTTLPAGAVVEPSGAAATEYGPARIEREIIAENSDGSREVLERAYLAEGEEAAWAMFQRIRQDSLRRQRQIARLNETVIGRVNSDIEHQRLRIREAERSLDRAQTGGAASRRISRPLWIAVAAAALAAAAGVIVVGRRARGAQPGRAMLMLGWARSVLALLAVVGALACWLEFPFSAQRMTDQRLGEIRGQAAAKTAALESEYIAAKQDLDSLVEIDTRFRAVFVEPGSGQFAPIRPTQPDDPMPVSKVVRAVPGNNLTFGGKLGVYASRWGEFLFDSPREANTEGGIWPVIFGTVLLTILLSIMVVPLGVIAATYLREYARQGLLTSIIRIAVNNLAGVPSIVYGVFALGFFCYGLGKFVDGGPSQASSRSEWWGLVALAVLLIASAAGLGVMLRPGGGGPVGRGRSLVRWTIGLCWLGAASGVILLVFRTPYFHGFYGSKLPTATFGTRGILWASLTLSLLTLPVVIVATEEAIAAVPRTMREGSYGCGASKWQTIRRIVLPEALPGIMTGAILAMARGAGEVAPLMLVGVMKDQPDPVIDGEYPFIHAERSFMHLGFHIFDLGFQSPDAEAARPLVWTTTLLLITVVLLLNLTAITIRSRLRARIVGSAI